MKKLVVANWKMHPTRRADAKKLFAGVRKTASTLVHVQTVVAPPFIYLPELSALYKGHRIAFAGQDVFWEESGSFTGEVSPAMLRDAGASYCIIGHSERRALGETNEMVGKKAAAALSAKLSVIICIGESERNQSQGAYLEFLAAQITTALAAVSQNQLSKVIVAYEPIWAIGKSAEDAMQPNELHETVLYIKKVIAARFGAIRALKVPVLYGGAVEEANAELLLSKGEIDGLLIGHASLSADTFGSIIRSANSLGS